MFDEHPCATPAIACADNNRLVRSERPGGSVAAPLPMVGVIFVADPILGVAVPVPARQTGGGNEAHAVAIASLSFLAVASAQADPAKTVTPEDVRASPRRWKNTRRTAARGRVETPGSRAARSQHHHGRRADRAQPDHRDAVLPQPRARQRRQAARDLRDHHPSCVLFRLGAMPWRRSRSPKMSSPRARSAPTSSRRFLRRSRGR